MGRDIRYAVGRRRNYRHIAFCMNTEPDLLFGGGDFQKERGVFLLEARFPKPTLLEKAIYGGFGPDDDLNEGVNISLASARRHSNHRCWRLGGCNVFLGRPE